MDLMMNTGVETSVIDMTTPVNVAINHGQQEIFGTLKTGIKDAVPPVQTAVSKTIMVKLFLKQDTHKSQCFHSSNFYRQCYLSTRISPITWRRMPCTWPMLVILELYFKANL